MRFRPTRRLLCLVVAATFLTMALLLLKQPGLPLSLSLTAPASTSSPSPPPFLLQGLPPRPRDPGYPVPPRPPKGDIPPYPVPDDLREKGPSEGGKSGGGGGRGAGGGGGGALERQGQGLVMGENGGKVPDNAVLRISSENGQRQQESPQKIADGLWELIAVPKQVLKADEQPRAPTGCVAKHHIFFGKVHKTGSSTVANILQRYGYIRDLNFLLPRKHVSALSYNYLTMAGQTPSLSKVIPPPLGQHYDVMWCHAIYHGSFFHSVLPQDTTYVTILRHPLEQFQSAFEYYGRMPGSYLNGVLQMNVSNPLAVYLQNPDRYENPQRLTSYVRNKQSQDLGMTNLHVLNATLRWQYIQRLAREFQLVMITEFFDESLVLLRRLMCWAVKDVLYITKNKNNFRQPRTFSPEDLMRHRQLNVADYDLYEFFQNRFHHTLKEQGPDLFSEVEMFKKLLRGVQLYCSEGTGNTPALMVPATPWSEAFNVSRYDCVLMLKHELGFLNDLMLEAVRKYQRSAVINLGS